MHTEVAPHPFNNLRPPFSPNQHGIPLPGGADFYHQPGLSNHPTGAGTAPWGANMNHPPGVPMTSHSTHHAPNHPITHGVRPPPTVSRALPTAGKVYPPNQPLVFNPTNPNAPPIYPCGICHKEVHDNDQAILCESGCNFWFHRICTGLTEHAYQMLTQEVYAEWVCDKCLATKNIPLVKMKP